MIQGINFALPLPAYVRHVLCPGGNLKRASLYAQFRLASKGSFFVDADVVALRAAQSKWDDLIARADTTVHSTPVTATGLVGE